jgi:hypothetical protein
MKVTSSGGHCYRTPCTRKAIETRWATFGNDPDARPQRWRLCKDHVQAFDHAVYIWNLWGEEIEPEDVRPRETPEPAGYSTEENRVAIARIKRARERAATKARLAREEAEQNERAAAERAANLAGTAVTKWDLAGSAVAAGGKLGFTADHILSVAVIPDTTHRVRGNAQHTVRQRGDCYVLVDMSQRKVLDVLSESEYRKQYVLHSIAQ